MGKYTADDNRSMQLNDNNDRYWSSRGIDDFIYDDDTNNLSKRNKSMFIEINNRLINLAHVQTIRTEVNKVDFKRYKRKSSYNRSINHILVEIVPEFTITFQAERWEEKVTISASVNDPDRIDDTRYPNRGSYASSNYSGYIPDVNLRSETKLCLATIVYGDEDFDQQAIKKDIEASSHGLTHAFVKELLKQHNPESQ
jgi:hypothetical protein